MHRSIAKKTALEAGLDAKYIRVGNERNLLTCSYYNEEEAALGSALETNKCSYIIDRIVGCFGAWNIFETTP